MPKPTKESLHLLLDEIEARIEMAKQQAYESPSIPLLMEAGEETRRELDRLADIDLDSSKD